MIDVSVVIPTKNEEAAIGICIERTPRVLKSPWSFQRGLRNVGMARYGHRMNQRIYVMIK
jgi:hypothetical protein